MSRYRAQVTCLTGPFAGGVVAGRLADAVSAEGAAAVRPHPAAASTSASAVPRIAT